MVLHQNGEAQISQGFPALFNDWRAWQGLESTPGPRRSFRFISDSLLPGSTQGSEHSLRTNPVFPSMQSRKLVLAILVSFKTPKRGTSLHSYSLGISWFIFPFAAGSRAKLGFAIPEAALRKTSSGVFVRPFLSGRFCREPHSNRKGHPAHLHGANENTVNSLENRVRHTSRAAGFIHGHAVKTPKMFPKKNAHKKYLKIYLEEGNSHCDEWH